MRRARIALLAVLVAASGLARGQEPLPAPTPDAKNAPAPQTSAAAPQTVVTEGLPGPPVHHLEVLPPGPPMPCDRLWMSADYLFWGVSRGPLFPMLTTGNPVDGPFAGAIGQPRTRVLFGDSGLSYAPMSGVRFNLGNWLREDRMIGVEGNVLLLERRSRDLDFRSDQIGNPPLYLAAFNPLLGGERALIIADPEAGFAGDFHVRGTLRLRGAEINGLVPFLRRPGLTVDLFAGCRYLDLEEGLQLRNTTTDVILDTVTTFNDSFEARNQFYGGQVGSRVTLYDGPYSLALTGKLALGSNLQSANVNGSITQTGTAAPSPGTFVGGFYAQPTNIGRRKDRSLSLASETELRAGYQLHRCLRLYLSATCLYWAGVSRTGDQIDRTLNLSQSPVFGGGTLLGEARPAPRFSSSDIWAYGISAGLEFRY